MTFAGLWPHEEQVEPLVTITPWSPECLGHALTGLNLPMNGAVSQTTTQHRIYYMPFVLSKPFLAKKAFMYFGTVQSDADTWLAVYDDKGCREIFADFAASTVTSAIDEVDITDTLLPAGLHYLGMSSDTANTCFAVAPTAAQMRMMGCLHEIVSTPAPTQATFSAVAGTPKVSIIGISGRSVI